MHVAQSGGYMDPSVDPTTRFALLVSINVSWVPSSIGAQAAFPERVNDVPWHPPTQPMPRVISFGCNCGRLSFCKSGIGRWTNEDQNGKSRMAIAIDCSVIWGFANRDYPRHKTSWQVKAQICSESAVRSSSDVSIVRGLMKCIWDLRYWTLPCLTIYKGGSQRHTELVKL